MQGIIAVFLGGGLGSLSRYGVSKLTYLAFKTSFPVGTLIANILSCLVLGLVLGWLKDKMSIGSTGQLFLLVGFCGGFSTFSTFSLENLDLFRSGNYGYVIANILVSISVCFAIIYFLTKSISE